MADNHAMPKKDRGPGRDIGFVARSGLCAGCGTCAALCPQSAISDQLSAISMEIDRQRGIYLPRINETTCDACGICVRVCPGHAVDFSALNEAAFGRQPQDTLLGNYLGCYTGHAADADIRYNSSSGGMASALLIYALEKGIIEGALVTRMNPEKPLEPQPFIARTREEILSATGSKYCPVPSNIALAEILKTKKGEKFAVVGLPCHMHGLRKAELASKKLRERVALRVGIFCSNTNTFPMTEYILGKHGIKPKQVTKLDYRGSGWPGKMSIQVENKALKQIDYEDYIKYHQFGFFTTRRCTLCCDMTAELADISLGDAWFLKDRKDDPGTSAVIVRSAAGRNLLDKALIGKAISIQSVPYPLALNPGDKRANLAAKVSLNRLAGKATPEYGEKMQQPRLVAYPYYLIVYFNLWVSSKKLPRGLVGVLLQVERTVGHLLRQALKT
ncbi:MAG: 4Fe-4S dicluster domain-containing protein [Dehalococcoidia bacterium]|nr:MAG: 4Fe-4S dicluster domain-containing protein [Dehalococcoidia bacterium]